LVIAGNHRDAWVYGAVDPSSGTAAMLESVHAMGALLKTGWRPKRTIIFASWDAEEYGLIGSTEYAEQYAKQLQGAIAYLNMDVGVSGPNFGASGVPSLKGFLRDVARAVPSPKGGSVYDVWKAQGENNRRRPTTSADTGVFNERRGEADSGEAKVGDLGSGSDYSAFLQHLGVPSTDIGSGGPYGVYHSVFDNYAWFTRNADPEFVYEQEMARVFGLEALRLAQADLLPFDYETYGTEVTHHLEAIERRARQLGWVTGAKDEKAAAGGAASSAAGGVADNAAPQLDFAAALKASARLAEAGKACHKLTATSSAAQVERLNQAYRGAERALLGSGLPHRTWFRHTIYAPGEYTGYAAVVLPGVTESMDKDDKAAAVAGLAEATAALQRAATLLESAL
jgi:N-acetylated-alpha-linked acidic dipeptidase